ncbi:WecB/TagA/CpsF family glycosyltransferase [Shewanella phaeophyticola]|uniref:WecB/TagA/CpsF family glycosyltransferase n=1 Tax=Shewanella phaeophyticola TaxID=2978345 RepID=A0ABT2P558_9GAMM|nr:WecB/TagA/CpsF family glycosyltransferase [Shewanella sp. KJ10-1]MCT8987049.1 WecB/TagA/CpsF family glycosyltransferase [Shewanella sp. KJ10-1]
MIFSNSVGFLGVFFNRFTIDSLISFILDFKGSYITVVTPNVDHVVRFNSNIEFKKIYQQADITVNDSRILNLLSKIARIDIGSVIPGSDLTKKLIENLPCNGFPIAVIGGSNETIKFVVDKYNLTSLHHYNPPMGFIDNEAEVGKCVNFILDNPSKIIFICVGSPRQEILSMKIKDAGATGVALCVGASFLFLSGEEKRAPQIIQKLSLEWLFRFIQSPKRLFKRYIVDGVKIVPIFLKYIINRD